MIREKEVKNPVDLILLWKIYRWWKKVWAL